MFARPFIDSVIFARNGEELCGEIQLAALPRLGDLLMDDANPLTYRLYGLKEGDRLVLSVALKGVCHLRCQRCLGELLYPLDTNSRLMLVASDKLAELDADDDMDGIEATSQLDVLALIEDEVLLSLPFAPKHPEGTCRAAIADSRQSVNPFSVLAELKNK
jgi:uncharacterized protein